MKNLIAYASTLVLLLFLSVSCGKDGVNPNDCNTFNHKDIKISIQEQYTTLPGKVSIFFKVDGEDGNSIPKLYPENFTIYERGRNDDCPNLISNNESSARISPNSQIFVYNTMLVLDLSGSVIGSSLTELKEASKSFIDNVMTQGTPDNPDNSFRMGIWWFDGEDVLHPLIGFTNDVDVLKTKIDDIRTDISQDPSTDLYGAVIKSTQIAYDKVQEYQVNEILSASSIVIFTDGTDQASRHSYDEMISTVKGADASIKYFTIGLGDEIDQDVLNGIGTDGTIFADNKEELEAKFKETADLVAGEANSFYLFEYCSPKRDGSGISEVTVVVEYEGKKGVLQTTFDATGFTSGCN
jgi:uncharacterized protein YegL